MSTNSAAWQSVVVRFNARVQKTDSCWLWTAKPKPKGYGQLTVAGRSLGAHVVAWMIANNTDIAPTLWVLHTCDNRLCVNPDHLFLGTCIDNLDDMCEKVVRGGSLRFLNRTPSPNFVAGTLLDCRSRS